jgi:hypothetical protein
MSLQHITLVLRWLADTLIGHRLDDPKTTRNWTEASDSGHILLTRPLDVSPLSILVVFFVV